MVRSGPEPLSRTECLSRSRTSSPLRPHDMSAGALPPRSGSPDFLVSPNSDREDLRNHLMASQDGEARLKAELDALRSSHAELQSQVKTALLSEASSEGERSLQLENLETSLKHEREARENLDAKLLELMKTVDELRTEKEAARTEVESISAVKAELEYDVEVLTKQLAEMKEKQQQQKQQQQRSDGAAGVPMSEAAETVLEEKEKEKEKEEEVRRLEATVCDQMELILYHAGKAESKEKLAEEMRRAAEKKDAEILELRRKLSEALEMNGAKGMESGPRFEGLIGSAATGSGAGEALVMVPSDDGGGDGWARRQFEWHQKVLKRRM